MPTYDYKCVKCEHKFERFHGMNESPEIKCPVCGAATEKMIGAGAGLIFKGTGFYETDYKRKSSGDNRKHPAAKNGEKNKAKTEKKEKQEKESTAKIPNRETAKNNK